MAYSLSELCECKVGNPQRISDLLIDLIVPHLQVFLGPCSTGSVVHRYRTEVCTLLPTDCDHFFLASLHVSL